jgi:hypothetical protein
MQQVQKVNDYCTPRENCPTCCIQHFFYDRTKKKREKNNDKQQFSPVRRV